MKTNCKELSFNQIRVLVGSIFLFFPLCMSFIQGNVMTYMYSYFYQPEMPDDVISPAWMIAANTAAIFTSNLGIDYFRRILGLRVTLGIGILFINVGLLATYFTISISSLATIVTYEVMVGIGDGITIATTSLYVAGWFGAYFGFAFSVAGSSSGIGGVVFNQVITRYINDKNMAPDSYQEAMSTFSQTDIIRRVPMSFLIIGVISTVVQVTGFCLMKLPQSDTEKMTSLPDSELSESMNASCSQLSNNIKDKQIGNRQSESSHSQSQQTQSMAQDLPPPSSSLSSLSPNQPENNTTLVINNPSDTNTTDTTPMQVLKMEVFYLVWFSAFALSVTLLIPSTYYKIYGELWIADDAFLATVGSLFSFVSVPTRVICGIVADKWGMKISIIAHQAICVVFVSSWYFTAMVSRWWFMIWTVVIMAIANNIFILYPIVTLRLFGKRHYGWNIFLVQSAIIVVMVTMPIPSTVVQATWGWFPLFSISFIISLVSFILCVVRMPRV